MGILALLTRETPAAIAVERKSLRTILEMLYLRLVKSRSEWQHTRHGLSHALRACEGIGNRFGPGTHSEASGESLRQCFQQSGLPDTAKRLTSPVLR